MASIEIREGRSGVSFRVSWRLEDGRQQSRSFRIISLAADCRSRLTLKIAQRMVRAGYPAARLITVRPPTPVSKVRSRWSRSEGIREPRCPTSNPCARRRVQRGRRSSERRAANRSARRTPRLDRRRVNWSTHQSRSTLKPSRSTLKPSRSDNIAS